VAWIPSPIPVSAGIYATNNELTELESLAVNGKGPEDLTIGPDGYIYTGLEDGRIIRFRPERPDELATYVNTGGRPLGLKFTGDGHLIVADGIRGLLSVDKDRLVHTLTDSVDDSPLVFVNHLDIAGDGTIWFSDSSQRFKGEALLDMMEGSATGRLLSYDPRTGMTKVHLEELRFANGVSVSPGDEFVLVSETLAARVIKLWISGPRAGTSEPFIDELPGYPDNISYNENGVFWIALPVPRVEAMENLASKPMLRSMLMRLPMIPSPSPEAVAWVIGVDVNGAILGSHQSWSGDYSMATSVTEINGMLYLGSIELESIARVPVPQRILVE
jgi:sugar lactone lactonase YvrE